MNDYKNKKPIIPLMGLWVCGCCFCLFLSIALANSLNDWRLTSVNI